MSKSNINIQSNIYIVKDELRKDQAFLQQVRGRSALEYLLKYNIIGSIAGFNTVQRNLYKNELKCTLADDGDFGFGIVKKEGQLEWQCRCEKTSCSQFKTCRPDLVGEPNVIESQEKAINIKEHEQVAIKEERIEESVSKETLNNIIDNREEEILQNIEVAEEVEEPKIQNEVLNIGSSEELKDYFIDLLEDAEQLKMIYKLNESQIGQITGRKNKILILTQTEEESIIASQYLYMSGIKHLLIDKTQRIIDESVEIAFDNENRQAQQVHVASLQELSLVEEIYKGIIFTFEDIDALEQLPIAYLQRLYSISQSSNSTYISILREGNDDVHNLKMKDEYIDWTAFNEDECQGLLQEYIEQGEPISLKKLNMDEKIYYIYYADMPIGKMTTSFTDDIKKLWEKVYDKKLDNVQYLPMEVEGILVREKVICNGKNNTWIGIRLQGYAEIESRYN